MQKAITKRYSNGEVTVVWQPGMCIHSGICARGLPDVFQPKERPWVKIDDATTQQIINQVAQCPSGALSTIMENENNESAVDATSQTAATQITLMKNGPMIVDGDIDVIDADGNVTHKSGKTALCRCGASENKPYCDGSHRKAGFEG